MLLNTRPKLRSVTLLALAEIMAMSLWFVSSAVQADLATEVTLGRARVALLSAAVPLGFVVGALTIALSGLADTLDPRRVFAASAILAAVANATTLALPTDSPTVVLMRALTGAFLAGVYPVGMKIMVGWGDRDRGWLVGLLVGALTLGSAAPHLIAWLGGSHWRTTTTVASLLAASSAVLVLACSLGPHHARAARLDLAAASLAWTDKKIRLAFGGYLGHMWELYALWAWIGTATAVSYGYHMSSHGAERLSTLTAFVAIGAGALLCPLAGKYADHIGKARLTIIAMAASGSAGLAMAVVFGGAVPLVFTVAVLWGLAVIPDSAQFSALVADAAPPDKAGSLLTLQTACGFALATLTVQATPLVAAAIGWKATFVVLALGPAFGIVSMWRLRESGGAR